MEWIRLQVWYTTKYKKISNCFSFIVAGQHIKLSGPFLCQILSFHRTKYQIRSPPILFGYLEMRESKRRQFYMVGIYLNFFKRISLLPAASNRKERFLYVRHYKNGKPDQGTKAKKGKDAGAGSSGYGNQCQNLPCH